MALWYSGGGYVFPVVVKPKILTFKVKFDLGGQGPSPINTIGILTKMFWCWQAQNGRNFDLQVKFDLEGQDRLPQNNRDLNQVILHLWSKFGDPSLNGAWVIAWTSKWLTHRRMDGRTETQTQAPTIPKGQNWTRVKTGISDCGISNP